jgi:hypothetical protein
MLNKNKKKLYIISGHDTTIVPLLYVLGSKINEWIPYVFYYIFLIKIIGIIISI